MMWLMMVILRVVRLIETVLLFFTCVIFCFLVCGYRCRDVITIHTLIGYGKNSTHTFGKLFGKTSGASERGTKSCIEVRLEPFPDGESTGADSMMTSVRLT
jgi:hypothetical protein